MKLLLLLPCVCACLVFQLVAQVQVVVNVSLDAEQEKFLLLALEQHNARLVAAGSSTNTLAEFVTLRSELFATGLVAEGRTIARRQVTAGLATAPYAVLTNAAAVVREGRTNGPARTP